MSTGTHPAHTAETATASTLSAWMMRWTNVQTARIHQRHFVSIYPVTLKMVQGRVDERATLARIFSKISLTASKQMPTALWILHTQKRNTKLNKALHLAWCPCMWQSHKAQTPLDTNLSRNRTYSFTFQMLLCSWNSSQLMEREWTRRAD